MKNDEKGEGGMNTIAQQWDLYSKAAIPEDAPLMQRQEMRRSFYVGAEAVLAMLLDISAEGVSEDAGVGMIEGWQEECRLFAQQVVNGKA